MEKTEKKTEEVKSTKSNGELWWESMKETTIEVFGLSHQTVDKYCTVFGFTNEEILVKVRAGAVISALEEKFKDFTFDQTVDGVYLSIKKKQKPEVRRAIL
jgi:hypothetical protein